MKEKLKWIALVLVILCPLLLVANHLDRNVQKERRAQFEREFGISYTAALADKVNAEAIMMNHMAALELTSDQSSAQYYSLRKELTDAPAPSSTEIAKSQLLLQQKAENSYNTMYADAHHVYEVCNFLYEYDTSEPGYLFPDLPILYPQACQGPFLYDELN